MTEVSEASAAQPQALDDRGSNRSHRPNSPAFRAFIATGWAPRPQPPAHSDAATWAQGRRERLSARFPGDRLVLPAGPFKVRSNDTDYRYRPHSAFAHLTGLGADREPDAVLVLEPRGPAAGSGHDARLYLRPRAERDSEEFWASPRYGEFWVGVRPSLAELEAELGLVCRHRDDLADDLAAAVPGLVRIVPGADPDVSAMIAEADPAPPAAKADPAPPAAKADPAPPAADTDTDTDTDGTPDAERADTDGTPDAERADTDDAPPPTPGEVLAEALSELRLVKDAWEVAQMRAAVAATVAGFTEVVRSLPAATTHTRGERVVETAFEGTARREGNGVGYDTIAASGPHACTLHWIRNDGPVLAGDLLLVDAGVEVDSLYTADVTRTLPVSGTFSPAQRRVYSAVLEAADAAFAAARPGVKFREVHQAAMEVVAARLEEWGLLPVTAAQALDRETGGEHRRWMVHGTSHHLGLDVHDCAQARREMYLDADLEPGMVFTIEPGLYFKADDLLVPAELRGVGVRIEDDVLVTADGVENLSAALPRRPEDVEAWMATLR